MRSGEPPELGGVGKEVEVDETHLGAKEVETLRARHTRGPASKRAVLALVERGGHARAFHVEHATRSRVGDIVRENVSREAALMTDESRLYTKLGAEFARPGGRPSHGFGRTPTPPRTCFRCSSVA